MLDLHPLRATGRTGGVDDVTDVPGIGVRLRPFEARARLLLNPGAFHVEEDCRDSNPVILNQIGGRDDGTNAGVFDDESDPVGRITRIERHVGGPALERSEDAHV